jgi:hypothetical protein
LAWRCSGWWLLQKRQNRGHDRIVHRHRQGKIRRYDEAAPLTYGTQITFEHNVIMLMHMFILEIPGIW